MRATSNRALARLAPFLLLVAGACQGDEGDPGPPGPPSDDGAPSDELARGDEAPVIELEVLSVEGASGLDGRFQVGDRIELRFRARAADGTPWNLLHLSFGRAHFAGPTFNYQRVLAEVDDVLARAEHQGDDVWRYVFAHEIPAHYAAPYNDTDDFTDGELTGQALLSGTYTVGLSLGWRYTVEGERHVAVGEAAVDVRFGDATVVDPRAVTTAGHCNRCHVDLTHHDGERRQLVQCLMCHTSGAEDANDPGVLGGTPGVGVDSRLLFHRIHNAAHLPSVLGITVDADGAQQYDAPPQPLVFAGADGQVHDYSDVGHPVWPQRTIPRPKNLGYSALDADAQRKEDLVRTGLSSCYVCHGDPDGDGPLDVPPDGGLIYAQPARRSCGACHDDVDWTLPYVTNGQLMDPQPDDSQCVFCHDTFGGALSIDGGHLHPLHDPTFDPGYELSLRSLVPHGSGDGDASLDPGELLAVTFTLTDGTGADVDPADLDAVEVVLAGPTSNAQALLRSTLPPALLAGPQPFTVDVPERRALEYVGDSSAAGGESFMTAARPHLALPELETRLFLRSATGASSTLAAAAPAGANALDLADASAFARGDVLVVDDGASGLEEYLEVRLVDGERVWFGSPDEPELKSALSHAHALGAPVARVTLSEATEGVDYALAAGTGTLTELSEFGAGTAVVVSYATPYRLPASYPAPANDSPDLGPESGEWSGLALAPGTYALTLSAWDTKSISFAGETSLYPIRARAQRAELQVADAPLPEPYRLIDDPDACNACHQDLTFHAGASRGFAACLACHGTAGAEDLARYVAADAPATSGVSVSLRELLHRIHRGATLDDPDGFVVVGEGPDPYPDNFETNTYGSVHFPARPGATSQCAKCHGPDNAAWREPGPREHPDGQDPSTRSWRAVCTACHDAPAAVAHVDAHTSGAGVESCTICHAPGEPWDVQRMHHPY